MTFIFRTPAPAASMSIPTTFSTPIDNLTIRHATDDSGKEINRVLGGFKATVHSAYLLHLSSSVLTVLAILIDPNVGEEAKERAKEELGKHGVDIE